MNQQASKQFSSRILAPFINYYNNAQTREKQLLLLITVGLLIFICAKVYTSIEEAFNSQEERLTQIVKEADLASAALYRYQILKSRLAVIEDQYKEVQVDANESYFERMIKQKAGIATPKDFNIRPRASKDFGGEYKQTSFLIKFTIVDPVRLADFLKELTHGAKPVLLSRISIKPRFSRDALDVEIEVSSIKKAKA